MSLDIYLTLPQDAAENEWERDVFSANITHNLTPMWSKAGVYDALYKSEGKKASEITETLKNGIADMLGKPEEYEALNASNGWGLYENAWPWLIKLYQACIRYPDAIIGVSA